MPTIQETLTRLVAANEAYRRGEAPMMTDAEYDALEDALAEAVASGDPSDPTVAAAAAFLASIGSPPADDSGWTKVRHDVAMQSLNKAQDASDLRSWAATVGRGAELVWTEKLDGISCFDEATPIHLANGERISIGDVVRNDLRPAVLTWSPETGLGVSQITDVHDNGPREDWVRLTLEDGTTILVTSDHLFYVKDKGWVPAKDLLGEDIITPDE